MTVLDPGARAVALDDPYRRPQADIAPVPSPDDAALADVRIGQKLVNVAVLLYIAAIVVSSFIPLLGALVLLGMFGTGLVGVYRLARGFGHALWLRVLLLLLLVVPLVGLLVLLRLNARATARLRAAGYSVGLLGARS